MHSKKWVKEHEWKTISGNHIGFSGNDVVAPEFYKDFRKKQGWHEPKKSVVINGKVKQKAPRHREVKIDNIGYIQADPIGTPIKSDPTLERLLKIQTFDFYFSYPDGYKDKVTLNADENDLFSAILAFNKWNYVEDAKVTKIIPHETVEEEAIGYKNSAKFNWLKDIDYPIEFPTFTLVFEDDDIPNRRKYWDGQSWIRVGFIKDSHGVTIQEENFKDWIIDAKIHPKIGRGLHRISKDGKLSEEQKHIEVPLITDPRYKTMDINFERREDERIQNESIHERPKDKFSEEILGFDTGDIEEMKYNSILDDIYLMDDGSTFTDKKVKEWLEHEAKEYEKPETKSESIDNISSYLEQEYQKRRDTLSSEPIIVFPKNIKVIQEAIDFAKSNGTKILFPFKIIDFLIIYRKDYQNNKILNMEINILDKSNKMLYNNKDYDLNLNGKEILQIVKTEEERQSVDDWKWTPKEKIREVYRVFNENTHEIMSGLATYKTARKILRNLSEQYPDVKFSIDHV